jgi:hypothetical protein
LTYGASNVNSIDKRSGDIYPQHNNSPILTVDEPPNAFLTSPPTPISESLLCMARSLLSCTGAGIGSPAIECTTCVGRSAWLTVTTELFDGGMLIGVWGALRGGGATGAAPGSSGGDFVLRGDELGVDLGELWWFFSIFIRPSSWIMSWRRESCSVVRWVSSSSLRMRSALSSFIRTGFSVPWPLFSNSCCLLSRTSSFNFNLTTKQSRCHHTHNNHQKTC